MTESTEMTHAIDWAQTSILVTGGSGSFGRAFTEHALRNLNPRKVVIFSRDELKQFQMRQDYPVET